MGVHRQDEGKVDIRSLSMEDSLWGLMQWWFQNAVRARRCVATGLMLPMCVWWKENTRSFSWRWSIESRGNFLALNKNALKELPANGRAHDGRSITESASFESVKPTQAWVERGRSKARGADTLVA